MANPPPHNLEAERALLGAAIVYPHTAIEITDLVSADDFYGPAHVPVHSAIQHLVREGSTVDAVTVAGEMQRQGTANDSTAKLLAELTFEACPKSSVDAYANMLAESRRLRSLLFLAAEITSTVQEGEPSTAVIESAFSSLSTMDTGQASSLAADDVLTEQLDWLERSYEKGNVGTSTGFTDLDSSLAGGFHPQALYILGGRPAMGKTALALCMAANVAMGSQRPVVLFSLEMGRVELMLRLMSSESRVGSKRIHAGELTETEWSRLAHAANNISSAPLFINDTSTSTVHSIRSEARQIKNRVGDLGLVVIDYLQLMHGARTENRQVEVSEISRSLKILARELNCPVLALSQLSRGLESRLDKRPMLSDLRESGALEQDADVVMFVYRDEVYNDSSPDKGVAEVSIAKQRNGPTGMVRLAFMDQYTKFASMARTSE